MKSTPEDKYIVVKGEIQPGDYYKHPIYGIKQCRAITEDRWILNEGESDSFKTNPDLVQKVKLLLHD